MTPRIIGEADIGQGNEFGANVVIMGPVTIGDGNYFAPNVVIGGRPRQLVSGEMKPAAARGVRIGSHNYFGEGARLHFPVRDSTTVGDRCAIGAGSHLAHDVQVGSHIIISVNCSVGGYVRMLDWSGLGMGCAVHPRTVVGSWAFGGMGAIILADVQPARVVAGNPARFLRWNFEALRRSGLDAQETADLRAYLEEGHTPATGVVSAAVHAYAASVAATRRNPVLRSWGDLGHESVQ
jgi:UDP-N-acetylglucosamine acyltransferase